MVQSAVYALGLLGTNDGVDPLDQRIRAALAAAPKTASDQQARNFALIALAKSGGRFAQAPARPEDGIDEVSRALLGQLADGKIALGSWAALACGVLGHELLETSPDSPKVGALQRVVRESLRDTKNPTMVGALAISSGLLGDVEAAPLLLERLKSEKDDDACGYVAVGLGLMGARDAVAGIQAIVAESKYRPELLKQTAIALGLLGDKSVVPQLLALLQEARGLASQASVASALGFIGDRRSVAPLTAMLANPELTPRARAFAAVALGLVGDKELLPWSTKIGLDLNYRATTQTLTDRTAGTGILDIL